MKTILALMAAVLTFGLLSPAEAQAGHRRYYSGHCNSGALVVQNLLYLAARGQYCGPSYGSYYGDYYPRASYGYYSYPRASYGYYSSPRVSYGYGCAPQYYYRSYPSRYYGGSNHCWR